MASDDVGHPVGDALGAQRRAVAEVLAAPEARAVELGHQVVVVEDEARALAAQAARGQQQEVGRVAGVDDVEAPLAREPAHELAQAPQGLPVLARVAERAARGAQRVAVDLDALEHLEGRAVAIGALGTGDDDLPSGGGQRAADVPHPAVGRDGSVLADDEDAAGAHQAAPRPAKTTGTVRARIFTLSHSDRRARVLDVERDHLLEAQLRAAVDLPEAGHAGLDREAIEPVRRIVLDLVGDRRARARRATCRRAARSTAAAARRGSTCAGSARRG